jgi:hypothetical protein
MGAGPSEYPTFSIERALPPHLVGTWDDEQTGECGWMRLARWRNRMKRFEVRLWQTKRNELAMLGAPFVLFIAGLGVQKSRHFPTRIKLAYAPAVASAVACPFVCTWYRKEHEEARKQADIARSRYRQWLQLYGQWRLGVTTKPYDIGYDYYALAKNDPAPLNQGLKEKDIDGDEDVLMKLPKLD